MEKLRRAWAFLVAVEVGGSLLGIVGVSGAGTIMAILDMPPWGIGAAIFAGSLVVWAALVVWHYRRRMEQDRSVLELRHELESLRSESGADLQRLELSLQAMSTKQTGAMKIDEQVVDFLRAMVQAHVHLAEDKVSKWELRSLQDKLKSQGIRA